MKLHVGGTYKINFVGMTSAFTVKRLDSQSDMALVIDVMGKDQKVPIKYINDGITNGFIKEADKKIMAHIIDATAI